LVVVLVEGEAAVVSEALVAVVLVVAVQAVIGKKFVI
jgi:hypothetical protein